LRRGDSNARKPWGWGVPWSCSTRLSPPTRPELAHHPRLPPPASEQPELHRKVPLPPLRPHLRLAISSSTPTRRGPRYDAPKGVRLLPRSHPAATQKPFHWYRYPASLPSRLNIQKPRGDAKPRPARNRKSAVAPQRKIWRCRMGRDGRHAAGDVGLGECRAVRDAGERYLSGA
jgi:hypothetical protein